MGVKSISMKLLLGIGTTGALLTLSSTVAFAAGSGYGPPSNGAPTQVPGGYTVIVASGTISSKGGTVAGSYEGEQLNVSIAANSVSVPVQVTLYAPTNLSLVHGVAGASVQITNPITGVPISSSKEVKTLASSVKVAPFTLTISSSKITSVDQIDVYNGGKFVLSSTGHVSSGVATAQLNTSETFVVLPSTSSSTIAPLPSVVPGATSVHTGKPFLGEEILGGVFGLFGLFGVVVVTRRRRLFQTGA
jgi:hypothetical protein